MRVNDRVSILDLGHRPIQVKWITGEVQKFDSIQDAIDLVLQCIKNEQDSLLRYAIDLTWTLEKTIEVNESNRERLAICQEELTQLCTWQSAQTQNTLAWRDKKD